MSLNVCVPSHFWFGYMMCIHTLGWTNSTAYICGIASSTKCVCAYRASSLNVSACLPKFHSPYLPIQFQKSIVKYWMGQTLFEFKSDFTASILHCCAAFVWWLLFSSSTLSLSLPLCVLRSYFDIKYLRQNPLQIYTQAHSSIHFVSTERRDIHSMRERESLVLLQTCSTYYLCNLISKIHI